MFLHNVLQADKWIKKGKSYLNYEKNDFHTVLAKVVKCNDQYFEVIQRGKLDQRRISIQSTHLNDY